MTLREEIQNLSEGPILDTLAFRRQLKKVAKKQAKGTVSDRDLEKLNRKGEKLVSDDNLEKIERFVMKPHFWDKNPKLDKTYIGRWKNLDREEKELRKEFGLWIVPYDLYDNDDFHKVCVTNLSEIKRVLKDATTHPEKHFSCMDEEKRAFEKCKQKMKSLTPSQLDSLANRVLTYIQRAKEAESFE